MLRPTVWKSLPSFVRTADSFTSFMSQLTTYMFARHVLQEELQRLRDESSDAVVERDRLKEEISSLENNCGEKSGEMDRLNKQLEAISVELKVRTSCFFT